MLNKGRRSKSSCYFSKTEGKRRLIIRSGFSNNRGRRRRQKVRIRIRKWVRRVIIFS